MPASWLVLRARSRLGSSALAEHAVGLAQALVDGEAVLPAEQRRLGVVDEREGDRLVVARGGEHLGRPSGGRPRPRVGVHLVRHLAAGGDLARSRAGGRPPRSGRSRASGPRRWAGMVQTIRSPSSRGYRPSAPAVHAGVRRGTSMPSIGSAAVPAAGPPSAAGTASAHTSTTPPASSPPASLQDELAGPQAGPLQAHRVDAALEAVAGLAHQRQRAGWCGGCVSGSNWAASISTLTVRVGDLACPARP